MAKSKKINIPKPTKIQTEQKNVDANLNPKLVEEYQKQLSQVKFLKR